MILCGIGNNLMQSYDVVVIMNVLIRESESFSGRMRLLLIFSLSVSNEMSGFPDKGFTNH